MRFSPRTLTSTSTHNWHKKPCCSCHFSAFVAFTTFRRVFSPSNHFSRSPSRNNNSNSIISDMALLPPPQPPQNQFVYEFESKNARVKLKNMKNFANFRHFAPSELPSKPSLTDSNCAILNQRQDQIVSTVNQLETVHFKVSRICWRVRSYSVCEISPALRASSSCLRRVDRSVDEEAFISRACWIT